MNQILLTRQIEIEIEIASVDLLESLETLEMLEIDNLFLLNS